jgi:uncharacterized protein (TIGR03067 family)
MSWRLLLLIALVFAGGFSPAPLPRRGRDDPAAADLRRLQGTWVVIRLEHDRRDYLAGSRDEILFTFRGRSMTLTQNGEVGPLWDVELSPGSTPRALTKTRADRGAVRRGIYRFDGERLIICQENDDGVRPTRFDSRGDRCLIVLKRR